MEGQKVEQGEGELVVGEGGGGLAIILFSLNSQIWSASIKSSAMKSCLS